MSSTVKSESKQTLAIVEALRSAEERVSKLAAEPNAIAACAFYARGGRWIVEPPREVVLGMLQAAQFQLLAAGATIDVALSEQLHPKGVLVRATLIVRTLEGAELLRREDFGEALLVSQSRNRETGAIEEEDSEIAVRSATTRALKRALEQLFPSLAAFYRQLSDWAGQLGAKGASVADVKRQAVEAYRKRAQA